MKKVSLIIAMLSLSFPCRARTIALNADGTGDYPTIQAAVDEAENGDVIVLNQGTYTGTGNINVDFKGKPITVQGTDPNDPCVVAATIIDCNCPQYMPRRGFYFHTAEGPDSVLQGLSIIAGEGGQHQPNSGDKWGGDAILCNNASPTIMKMKVSNCGRKRPSDAPHAVALYSSAAKVIACEITNNIGAGVGTNNANCPEIRDCVIKGNPIGILVGSYSPHKFPGGSVRIVNCDITDNASPLSACIADVNILNSRICHNSGSVSVTECNLAAAYCTITNNINSIAYGAGGVAAAASTVQISDCFIADNTIGSTTVSSGINPCGGGIYFASGRLTITRSRIQGNHCLRTYNSTYKTAGGGIWTSAPTEITDSLITGNSAHQGGALYIKADANLVNCLIADNIGMEAGAAFYQADGNVGFTHCTFAGNPPGTGTGTGNSATSGDALFVREDHFYIWNSIVWDMPTTWYSPEIYHSNIRDGRFLYSTNISQDPLFSLEDDYRLCPASPSIDAAANTPYPSPILPLTDIEGNPRSLDGNGDGSAVPDMGAYEFDPNSTIFSIGPERIFFTYDALNNPQTKTLAVRCPSGGPVNWQITGAAGWLHVSPSSGTASPDVTEVVLTADGSGLPIGAYECTLTATETSGRVAPVDIEVTLHVGRVLNFPRGYDYIQQLIDEANDFDVIVVADGTYNSDAIGGIRLDFKGKKIIFRSQNGPDYCTLDFEGGSGVYFHTGETSDCVLKGFKLTRGSGVSVSQVGGAAGGAICCIGAAPTITQCRIENNSAQKAGGGIFCIGSQAIISDCVIANNNVSYMEFGGGGIYCRNSYDRILNCKIIDNTSSSMYGAAGIELVDGDTLVYGCEIARNSPALGPLNWCYGGFVMMGGTISNCIIHHNVGHYAGGGGNESARIINSLILDNRGVAVGGLECGPGAQVQNCVIARNTALGYWSTTGESGAGAIWRDPEYYYTIEIPITINNCTVIDNYAMNGCNGLVSLSRHASILITSSIFRNGGNELFAYYSVPPDTRYCNVEGGAPGVGNVDAPLAFAFPNDCHPLSGSPSIDAGDPNYAAAPGETDPDGRPRLVDGDSDGNAVVDMGAYEFVPARAHLAVCDNALKFQYWQGWFDPAPQTLRIRNSGGGVLRWAINADCNWISLSAPAGESAGEIDEVSVACVNLVVLSPGTYQSLLTVTDTDDPAHPRVVEITLIVGRLVHVPADAPTIQAGIDAALDNDMVLVADGTYTGPGNYDLELKAKRIVVSSENGPGSCTIDCNSTHVGFNLDWGETPDSVIDGFTITRGLSAIVCKRYYGWYQVVRDSNPTIRNCVITANGASNRKGGGISCTEAAPTIVDCIISNNVASAGGGVYAEGPFQPTLLRCILSGNRSSNGGAVSNNYDSGDPYGGWSILSLTDCLLTGNIAREDGAALSGGYAALANCTIVGNLCTYKSGSVIRAGGGKVDMTNSVMWANRAVRMAAYVYRLGDVVLSYCDVQGGCAGTGNINADPCFVSPGYWDPNGTPDDANDDFWVDGDYHLTKSSPCLNAGDPNYVAQLDETDLDGNPRVSVGRIDIGAYEYPNTKPVADPGPDRIAFAWLDGLAEVTLDGAASRDADGDLLSYRWRWTRDNVVYEAAGASPVIVLPTGQFTVQLVVNDGLEDSEPNFVTVTVVGPLEASLWMSPRILNWRTEHGRVAAILRLPPGIKRADVDDHASLLLYPGEIEAEYHWIMPVWNRGREQVVIMAWFDKSAFLDAVDDNGVAEVAVVGRLISGRYFFGTDSITIINPPCHPHWWFWRWGWNCRSRWGPVHHR